MDRPACRNGRRRPLLLPHAAASISFRADQTVSGVAINMLALGSTLFVVKLIYGKAQTDKIPEPFYKTDIPGLSSIPVAGEIFSRMYM